MTDIEKAILNHGVHALFTSASAGACEDYEPLKAMGLDVNSIEEAEQVSRAVYGLMTAEEKAALHWEASQDLHKPSTRMPVGLPTSREEQVSLVESWLISEFIRRATPE